MVAVHGDHAVLLHHHTSDHHLVTHHHLPVEQRIYAFRRNLAPLYVLDFRLPSRWIGCCLAHYAPLLNKSAKDLYTARRPPRWFVQSHTRPARKRAKRSYPPVPPARRVARREFGQATPCGPPPQSCRLTSRGVAAIRADARSPCIPVPRCLPLSHLFHSHWLGFVLVLQRPLEPHSKEPSEVAAASL